PPVLRLRQRPGLDDPDDVAHLRLVLLVVRVELARAADDLFIARVGLDHLDLDDDRLVHRVRDDDAAALLTAARLALRLRQADDRLALGRRLALGSPGLGAQRARQTLLLALRLGCDGLVRGRVGGRLVGLRRRRLLGRRLCRLRLVSLALLLFLSHQLSTFCRFRRWFWTVRMRAISRFASRRRAEFSRAPVADW